MNPCQFPSVKASGVTDAAAQPLLLAISSSSPAVCNDISYFVISERLLCCQNTNLVAQWSVRIGPKGTQCLLLLAGAWTLNSTGTGADIWEPSSSCHWHQHKCHPCRNTGMIHTFALAATVFQHLLHLAIRELGNGVFPTLGLVVEIMSSGQISDGCAKSPGKPQCLIRAKWRLTPTLWT